jgi:hypothetical protein
MRNLRWSWWAAVPAVVVLVVGLAGLALAQSSNPAQINACAKKKSGALRVAAKCRKTERRVQWSTTGPQGIAGADGADGADGSDGAAGTAGTNGANGTNGTTTGQTFYAESPGVGSNFGTTCGAPSGPSVTFTAPAGAYIQIMAQADMQRAGAITNAVCLQVDAVPAFTILVSAALAYETRYLSQGNAAGTTDVFVASPFVFPVSAGSHTVSLSYSSTGGTSTFRNRKLWVTMFQPTS